MFANDANIVFALLLFANPLMTRSLTTLSQVSTSRRSSFGLFTGEMVKKYAVTELVTSVTSVFPPWGTERWQHMGHVPIERAPAI